MCPTNWRTSNLGDLARFESGGTPSREIDSYWNGTIPWFSAKDLKSFRLSDSEEHITEAGSKNGTRIVKPGTVLILVRGMTLLKSFPVGVTSRYSAFNQDLRAVIPKEGILGDFLAYWLLANERKIMSLVDQAGHGTGRLATDQIADLEVSLPRDLAEQQAIVRCLDLWSSSESLAAKIIARKLRFKHVLIHHVLTGKRRFGHFNGSDLRTVQLKDVLEKQVDPVRVDPDVAYREIGIRSHGHGIFHKEPVSGRSLGNKRVYKVIPGCLTLNIVFAWERALAVTNENETGMIASHRFPMFRPDPKRLLPGYVRLYLLSKKGNEALQLASPGGAGRNRTLSQAEFLKAAITLPTIAEQQKIVDFAEAIDREIDLLRRERDAFNRQKKALMQKLMNRQIQVRVAP